MKYPIQTFIHDVLVDYAQHSAYPHSHERVLMHLPTGEIVPVSAGIPTLGDLAKAALDHHLKLELRRHRRDIEGSNSSRNAGRSPAPVARHTDPSTSHLAAGSVDPLKRSAAHDRVLELLRLNGPTTDEGIRERWIYNQDEFGKISESGLRTRRRELVDAGLVKDSGRRATTRSGREAIMWEVVR